MADRIVFVDDERNVLDTFRRGLRKHYEIDIAEGGTAALRLLENDGPYAVIVSDLKMPRMSGIELLQVVKTRWPDTVRIMLTGHGDLETAMAAVNQGAIFRFLTKPCSPNVLLGALEDGLRQYRLVMAEKELLRGTLRGCIQVMSELLTLVSPEAFGRGEQGKGLVLELAQLLGLDGVWRYELASMLSQIGCISLPPDILARRLSGEELTPEEEQVFVMHPAIAGKLLRNIPRLESVADMVAAQEWPVEKDPPVGARILKAALDFTDKTGRGAAPKDVLDDMLARPDIYDKRIVSAIGQLVQLRTVREIVAMDLIDVREGMVLAEDVQTINGSVILHKGQPITRSVMERFIAFGRILGIKEPLYVLQAAPGGEVA